MYDPIIRMFDHNNSDTGCQSNFYNYIYIHPNFLSEYISKLKKHLQKNLLEYISNPV